MRHWLKYIYLILLLAVLIFQSLTLFYFAQTYAVTQKVKNSFFTREKPYFETSIHAPSVLMAVRPMSMDKIPDIQIEDTPQSEEIADDSSESSESSGDSIDNDLTIESGDLSEYDPEINYEPDTDAIQESANEIDEPTEEFETFVYDELSENEQSYNLQEDILLEILTVLKVNQYMTTLICSVVFIIWIYKPITNILK